MPDPKPKELKPNPGVDEEVAESATVAKALLVPKAGPDPKFTPPKPTASLVCGNAVAGCVTALSPKPELLPNSAVCDSLAKGRAADD